MACSGDNSAKLLGPQMVWSSKSTSSWNFHALGSPEDTTGYKFVRGTLENRSSSGSVKTRIVYRTSNDGITWGSTLAPYRSPNSAQEQTNDGTSYGALFVDITSDVAGYQYIQWGVEVQNTAGTLPELTVTTAKLDRRDA